MPEGYLPLSECALYLAAARKSNSAYAAYGRARDDVQQTLNQPVPLHLRNAVTGLQRAEGYGKGYKYAHDFENHYAEQQHLPESLADRRYYVPSDQGRERELAEDLRRRRGETNGA
jgi:putative ATPase